MAFLAHRRPSRLRRELGVATICALLAGCGPSEPDVAHYTVAKSAASAPEPASSAAAPGPDRMLAAILLQPQKGWFFKLQGPAAALAARQADFEALVKSVRFDGDQPAWSTPSGWRQDPGDAIRFALLRTEQNDPPLEISVTALPYSGGAEDYLLQNINRWRGQLQLAPIARDELAGATSRLETPSGEATLIDFRGRLGKGGMMGRATGSPPSAALAPGEGPAVPGAGPTPPGAMGRAPDDAVHRAAEAAAPVAAPPRPSAAGAVDAELPGRMLAAIVVRPGVAWFFKLLGPKDAVARHAAEFDALVASLRFAGDAPPEWHAPDGWRQAPAAGMRYATLTIEPAPDPGPTPTPPGEKAGAVAPAADKPLELSVISLPTGGVDELEYVLKNINRWRGQLGVARLSPEQLASASKRVAVDGAEAVVVDIEGTLSPEIDMSKAGGAGGPFAAPNAERPADPGSN